MKLYYLFSCIFFSFFLLSSSCERCKSGNCERNFVFHVDFRCDPALDTFRISDTIWISAVIPPTLFDTISKDSITLSKITHKIYSVIVRGDSVPEPIGVDAARMFDYVQQVGAIRLVYSNGGFLQTYYFETDASGTHSLRIGFIPKFRGLYSVSFAHDRKDYEFVDGLDDKNCFDIVEIVFDMNENKDDNNYYLLEDYPKGASPEGYKRDGSYHFRVIE